MYYDHYVYYDMNNILCIHIRHMQCSKLCVASLPISKNKEQKMQNA